jgi:hypothetical protein
MNKKKEENSKAQKKEIQKIVRKIIVNNFNLKKIFSK